MMEENQGTILNGETDHSTILVHRIPPLDAVGGGAAARSVAINTTICAKVRAERPVNGWLTLNRGGKSEVESSASQ